MNPDERPPTETRRVVATPEHDRNPRFGVANPTRPGAGGVQHRRRQNGRPPQIRGVFGARIRFEKSRSGANRRERIRSDESGGPRPRVGVGSRRARNRRVAAGRESGAQTPGGRVVYVLLPRVFPVRFRQAVFADAPQRDREARARRPQRRDLRARYAARFRQVDA